MASGEAAYAQLDPENPSHADDPEFAVRTAIVSRAVRLMTTMRASTLQNA
jgi:hypothetical protein